MGLEVFSEMTAVVEALLANRAAVASQCFVLLVGMFTDVMPPELVSSVKVSVAHSTRKAARLTMNGLSMSLQRFLASEHLGAKVAHGPLVLALRRGSVDYAECGVRSAECGKCGVWKTWSVENAECGIS